MANRPEVPERETEVAARTSLEDILYAQCWEDADVLLEGLDVQPGDVCVSIASAGDNTLALLTRAPRQVLAVDLDAAQLACLEIRVAALQTLAHDEFLELMGSRTSTRRGELYRRCRPEIRSQDARLLWDRLQPQLEQHGVGGVGRFERYWRLFRQYVVPLAHRQSAVGELLRPKSPGGRRSYFERHWNNRRWRILVRAFGSQRVLSWLGRESAFFTYVQGSTAKHVLERAAYAMTELSPAENPFLQWIFTGQHGPALPLAYRPEHFDTIRANLSRLQWHQTSVEHLAHECAAAGVGVDRFNLSDIFEYMSLDSQRAALLDLLQASHRGTRMLYWNMMVPRPIPADLMDRIQPMDQLAADLHARDRGFFYRCVNVAEVR